MKRFLLLVVLSLLANSRNAFAWRAQGVIDYANCSGIAGWAVDLDVPEEAVLLNIFAENGNFVAQPWTTDARPDVPCTRCSFFVPLPESLKDGNPHTIYLYGIHDGANWPMAEKTLSCKRDGESCFKKEECTGGVCSSTMHCATPHMVYQSIDVDDMVIDRSYYDDGMGYSQSVSAFTLYKSKPWPGGVVPLKFDAAVTVTVRDMIFAACEEWGKSGNVSCVLYDPQIHAGYLMVDNETANSGVRCSRSSIGAKSTYLRDGSWGVFHAPSRPQCMSYALVLHEMGHIFGLAHEHQRADRDNYLSVNESNLSESGKSDLRVLYKDDTQPLGPYDFLSIMHYPKQVYALDSAQDTLVPLPAYQQYANQMGHGSHLSAGDARGIGIIYGLPPLEPPVIESGSTASGVVGANFVYQISAVNSPTSFTVSELPANGLSLDPVTGLISGTPANAGVTQFTLKASNDAGTSPAVTLTVTIAPAPVAPPVILSAASAEGVVGSRFAYQIIASNLPKSYSVQELPLNGLSLDAAGLISGIPQTPGVMHLALKATNDGGDSNPLSLTVTIAEAVNPAVDPPVILSPATAAGVVGASFAYQIIASNEPDSFTAPELPANGLSMNSDGLITGKPVSSGVVQLTLRASNAGGSSAPVTLMITIASIPPQALPPVILSAATAAGVVGAPFAYQIIASNEPESYTVSELPVNGLSMDATGLITGTPLYAGIIELTLRAANASGTSSSVQLLINIAEAPNASPGNNAPKANFPSVVPVDATLEVEPPSNFAAVGYDWTITPGDNTSTLSPGGFSVAPFSAASTAFYHFRTLTPSANLSNYKMDPGVYLISVRAFDSKNKLSSAAEQTLTLKAKPNLSTINDLPLTKVFPNPWRKSDHSDIPVTWDNLPVGSTVKVFTVSGHLVETVSAVGSQATWNPTVASGVYLYLITADGGHKKTGQLLVVK